MLSGKALVAGVAALALLAGAGGYGGYRVWRHVQASAPRPAPRAAVVVHAPPTPEPTVTSAATPAPTPLPASVLIKVPYTSQFPVGVFGGKYEEYCEAAAVLMVGRYYKELSSSCIRLLLSLRLQLAQKNGKLLLCGLAPLETEVLSNTRLTSTSGNLPLAVVGAVGSQLFNLQPAVVPIDEAVIRQNLAEGRPVIVPIMTHLANGRPISEHYNMTSVYHVLLLTGYDAARDEYTTNDAGFIQGQNWQYPWSTITQVIDLQAQRMSQGRVMLVFSPR